MKSQKAPHSSGRKILGADMKSIGAAIAMAVVGEIAQSAINRTVRGVKESDQPEQTRHGLQATASSTQSAIGSAPPLKGASDIVQQVLEEVRPSIAALVEAVLGAPDATRHLATSTAGDAAETVDAAAQFARNAVQQTSGTVVESVQGTFQNGIAGIVEAVKDTVQAGADQPEKPSQKQKKKKKKGKKK